MHREAHHAAGWGDADLDDDVIGVGEEEGVARSVAVNRHGGAGQLVVPGDEIGGGRDEEADVVERAAALPHGRLLELRHRGLGELEEGEDAVRGHRDEVVARIILATQPMGQRDLAAQHVAIEGDRLCHIVRDDRDVMEHRERGAEAIAIGQR